VHEINSSDDLRRRLAPDRRCFGFFHPALPGEPLIFVEVALVEGLATAVPPLLSQDTGEAVARERAARADTAIFYSISNCQDGLRGVRQTLPAPNIWRLSRRFGGDGEHFESSARGMAASVIKAASATRILALWAWNLWPPTSFDASFLKNNLPLFVANFIWP
jgi:hypothetical protein